MGSGKGRRIENFRGEDKEYRGREKGRRVRDNMEPIGEERSQNHTVLGAISIGGNFLDR